MLAGLAAAALVAPATATADVTVSLAGGILTITGSADDDDIALDAAGSNTLGPTTSVSGGGQDMVAGPGCQGFGDPNGPANDNSVFCPTDAIARLQVDLLGGDDEFDGESFATVINGGPGEDDISIGDTGSDGVNTVDGGPDDDTIDVGRVGAADSIAGGAGVDTVTYASHAAVVVSLDGVANDGTGPEGDDVRPDVERVVGTAGADTLIGNAGPNTLDGAGGTDRLEGLGAADTLIGGPGTNDATFGGEGDDAIMLRDGLADACPSALCRSAPRVRGPRRPAPRGRGVLGRARAREGRGGAARREAAGDRPRRRPAAPGVGGEGALEARAEDDAPPRDAAAALSVSPAARRSAHAADAPPGALRAPHHRRCP